MSALGLFLLVSTLCWVASLALGAALRAAISKGARATHFLPSQSRRQFIPVGYGLALLVMVGGVGLSHLFWGSAVFGLLGLIGLPAGCTAAFRALDRRGRRQLEASSLPFFYSLSAFLSVGVSLPEAIFRLAKPGGKTYAEVLGGQFKYFNSGQSLKTCFTEFRRRYRLSSVDRYLHVLEMAYENGASLHALLERILPMVEGDLKYAKRVTEQKQAAIAQVVLASAVPYGLSFLLFAFQPEMMKPLFKEPEYWGAVMLALMFQLAGLVVLRRSLR